MNMKDVKAITIPEGTVKKIEDANGNVIWGSETAFPYRRLEYINFSGTEYIDTLEKPQLGYYFLRAVIPSRNTWSQIWGAADTVSNVLYRFFWQTNAQGKYKSRIKDDDVTTDVSMSSTTLQEFRLRIYATNNTNGRYWRAIQDPLTNTERYSLYTNNTSYAINLNNFRSRLVIGAVNTTNNTLANEGYWLIGKVYRYMVREGDGTSAFRSDMYPCQRKSDGVCGLYDVVQQRFLPLQGTNVTTSAAGTIVDEYWDLTAPS